MSIYCKQTTPSQCSFLFPKPPPLLPTGVCPSPLLRLIRTMKCWLCQQAIISVQITPKLTYLNTKTSHATTHVTATMRPYTSLHILLSLPQKFTMELLLKYILVQLYTECILCLDPIRTQTIVLLTSTQNHLGHSKVLVRTLS